MSGYREFAAGTPLGRFVECFWMHGEVEQPRPVLPDACIDIVFSHATGLVAVGTMTRPLEIHSRGAFVGVRFRPGLASCFAGVAPVEVVDRVTPLSSFWAKPARALEERLSNACGPAEMLSLFRAAFPPPDQLSPLQSAVEFLSRHAGAVSLAEICRLAGMGERQLRRRFLQETGVTPKQFARIARFRRVCGLVHTQPAPDWAALALACGYYDQAHLIHDFQEFSGSTPGNYVRQLAL